MLLSSTDKESTYLGRRDDSSMEDAFLSIAKHRNSPGQVTSWGRLEQGSVVITLARLHLLRPEQGVVPTFLPYGNGQYQVLDLMFVSVDVLSADSDVAIVDSVLPTDH